MILLSNIRGRATASLGLLRLFSHGFACRNFISLSDLFLNTTRRTQKSNLQQCPCHCLQFPNKSQRDEFASSYQCKCGGITLNQQD